MDVQQVVLILSGLLFREFAIGACPVHCRVYKGSVAVGADVLQCLLVFRVFVAGMVEKGLDGLAVFIFLAICACDVTFSPAALLHFTFGLHQIPGTVQIPLFATLAGLLKFTAGLTVGTTATDFLCVIHREEFPSV